MNKKILVDTDILIDISRSVDLAINRITDESKQAELLISQITQMELLIGCRNKIELQNLKKFLRQYSIVKVNELMADTAVNLLERYRLSHGLLIADALIASTAIVLNIPLLSKNQNDYRFITELQLLPYP